jgi:hypothetical protein
MGKKNTNTAKGSKKPRRVNHAGRTRGNQEYVTGNSGGPRTRLAPGQLIRMGKGKAVSFNPYPLA